MARVMGLDYGERRIGVAISDPTRTIAQPLSTIVRRAGKRPPYTKILELVEHYQPETIVIGLPIETSGQEGPQAARVREFGEGLRRRTAVVIEYWDERFTSERARKELIMLEPSGNRREKGRVDALAASFILMAYLNAGASG